MERRIARDLTPYLSQRPRLTLGQQKALDFKRARTFKEFAILGFKIVVSAALLLMALSAILGFRSYLLRSPRFHIAIKEIDGLHYVRQNQVLMKVKEIEERNRNLMALDIDRLRRSLELLPWVKGAIVRRALPDKLLIQVVERVPIAFARVEDSTWLVDEEGTLLETRSEQFSEFDFPVIVGFEAGFESDVLARNRKRIALYKRLMASLDDNGAGLSRDVSEVHVQDADGISVILNDDTVLVHLGADQFQEKFRRYLAMSRELKQKYPLLDSVDIRFENQLVINTNSERITSAPSN
jgi:cell division protein FtsQ